MAIMMHYSADATLQAQIQATEEEIRSLLWAMPAEVELAKVLISKMWGMRIVAGERLVKLRPAIEVVQNRDVAA
jgi:hypothetical protein